MKWVKMWYKVAGSSLIEVKYDLYLDHLTHNELKDICDDWVENEMKNYGDGYIEYDFEIIEVPPKKWLLDKINSNKMKIEIINSNNKFYEEEIEKHYRLNDKIERIKKNID
jgi:hypothetical protein